MPEAMAESEAPVSVPTWTGMILQPGQKPALPTPLSSARPATHATYVPWLPAFEDVSDVLLRTFQPGTTCPEKSSSPLVLRPVSRIAITTEGSPLVMSQACVVCVLYQPQAPPPTGNCCGKEGSLGKSSCGVSVLSVSANRTPRFPRSFVSAAAARFDGTVTTRTPMSRRVRSDFVPAAASAPEAFAPGRNLTRRRDVLVAAPATEGPRRQAAIVAAARASRAVLRRVERMGGVLLRVG